MPGEDDLHRLLLVDDDVELCEMLSEYLKPEGFAVQTVHNGTTALGVIRSQSFDLIVLDVMLPGTPGFDVLRQMRTSIQTPVIMLTARGEDVDRIVGLEIGADDYLPKPFNPRELVARIRAVLRRLQRPAAPDREQLAVGRIRLDTGTREVTIDGTALDLTGAEFLVLEMLMHSAGQVVSKDTLTESALGRKLTPYDRSIDTHISNLRRKLKRSKDDYAPIKNIRGMGYLLTPEE